MNLAFTMPEVLLLLLLTLALAALAVLTLVWQRRVHSLLAAGSEAPLLHGATSHRRRAVKASLTLVALVVLVIGAAGPKAALDPEALRPPRNDMMVVLDVSLSMLAPDVPPSRFEAGRRNVEALLDTLRGDCVGLAVFGGRGVLRIPCTLDYAAVRSALRATTIDSTPLPGSSLAEGLRTGLGALRQSAAPYRSILLISDGEDTGSDIEPVLSELQAAGIVVHVLATGTTQGSSIPQPVEDGRVTLKQDSFGVS